MNYSPKLSSPIFTDTPKMYLAYVLTVAYLLNFSLPIFTDTLKMYLTYVQTVAYLLNFSSPIRSFYLYDLPKIFPVTIFLCTEIRFQTQGSMEFIIRSSWAVDTTNSLRVKVL